MISWEQFTALLGMAPVQRAALGLMLGAVALPPVGVLIVGMDILPLRFAIMHVALLGSAIGLLTGLDPLVCALVLCAVAGGSLAPLAGSPAGLSGAMGVMMSLAIAVALLVLSVSGVNANGAFELLWGSILSTQEQDIAVLAVLAVVVPALYFWKRRDLSLLLHDRELAACSGVRTGALTVLLLVLVAVAIAGAIKLTGALLVDALTLLPALAARSLGRGLGGMVAWSIVLGGGVAIAGLFAALVLNQPPGPILVLLAGVVAIVAQVFPKTALLSKTRSNG
ncbi:metal ABC transporter permease [Saccharopolyspora shandongensis]|uniref:metal ABC transporter permease n=1 Tax=Saccharopolyspora shandongensis TaxID=418495 RepID=UPI0034483FDB